MISGFNFRFLITTARAMIVHTFLITISLFNSMRSSTVEKEFDIATLVGVLAVIGGLIGVLVAVSAFRKREEKPRTLRNANKLNRELMVKVAQLKRAEQKQLRILSEQEDIEHPVTLLICPSVLTKAASRAARSRLSESEKLAIASLLRKTNGSMVPSKAD
jgi:beta-lactamase regulating signal transducer with metallopeptidase domain